VRRGVLWRTLVLTYAINKMDVGGLGEFWGVVTPKTPPNTALFTFSSTRDWTLKLCSGSTVLVECDETDEIR